MKPDIELNISELVFHGYSALDARRIRDSFERELTRLLTREGIKHLPNVLYLDAVTLNPATVTGSGLDATGASIANAVFRQINSLHSPNTFNSNP